MTAQPAVGDDALGRDEPMLMDDPAARAALLARIEANIRVVAARGRDVVDVGPFRAFLSPDSSHYLLSLAVPLATPHGWAGAIVALDAAFAARGRRPRLEFLHECFPTLGTALKTAGYSHTMSAPAMVLTRAAFRPQAPVDGITFAWLTADDDPAIDAFLAMQSRAYDIPMGEADAGWRSMMQRGLADGSIIAGALLIADRMVSGASLLIGGGSAELAGVGTLPEHQRQGLAADTCSRLLEAFFARGHALCWLSAAEAAQGVYGRLGFRAIGEQRNYGRPPAGF